MTLQGYGELKSRFVAFLKLLNSFGKDVVLVAHMDEQRSGDDVIERLDVQGGSKNEIYKAADAMGRLVISNGQRRLMFSPTDAAFGKNPGQLPPIDVPDVSHPDFGALLASVIDQTKAKLNELSAEQQHVVAEQEWFRANLPKIDTADGLNELIERASKAGRSCKVMVNDRAVALGLTFDKDAGAYVAKEPEAA